jgi:hypothetical protein
MKRLLFTFILAVILIPSLFIYETVSNDIQNISGLTVKLRAERCGTGTGRIYTITV